MQQSDNLRRLKTVSTALNVGGWCCFGLVIGAMILGVIVDPDGRPTALQFFLAILLIAMGIGALAQGAEFGKRARAEALSEALDHEATGRKQQREHPFVFGFLARQLSRLESKAEKLAPIAAILIVC